MVRLSLYPARKPLGAMRFAGLCALLLCGFAAYGDSLARDTEKAFRKIGVSAQQIDAYMRVYEDFLKKRNSQIRRVLKNSSGEELPILAKRRVRRAARQSVENMEKVLEEDQMEYYAAYLDLANKLFLREAGLR